VITTALTPSSSSSVGSADGSSCSSTWSSIIAFTLRIGVEDNDSSMQVYSYDNPVNALIDFKPNFSDLLLIDVNMPLMDGFELCEKLLQKEALLHKPFYPFVHYLYLPTSW